MNSVSVFLIVVALVAGMVGCGDTPAQYNLAISGTTGGSVITPGEGTFTYDEGARVDLVAEADEGYYFVDWIGDVSNIDNANNPVTTITMQDNYTIIADFEQIPAGQFVLTIYSTIGGLVTTPGEGTFTYEEGSVVELVASPDADYCFVSWTGDVDTVTNISAATTDITMHGHYCITANFLQGDLIEDWYDLDNIRDDLDGYYVLVNDLGPTTAGYEELASVAANDGKGWRPIGWGYWSEGQLAGEIFEGTFDGQGHEIENLFIDRPTENFTALFGAIAYDGVIKNLGVVNASVTGNYHVSGLIGIKYGATMSNCYSTGYANGNYFVGGLVADNWGDVNNSYATTNVSGDRYVGGLLGGNVGFVNNSYSIGNADGNQDVGGLVGYNGGVLSTCYSTGNVDGGQHVGGLVGRNDAPVSNCYATGHVSGDSSVGGLLGKNLYGYISNCYARGSVTGIDTVGGLVADNLYGTISDCFWDTETSGQSTSDGGTGKTTAQMQNIATFSGATWDIIAVADSGIRNTSYIWNMVADETYPFLSWQPVS